MADLYELLAPYLDAPEQSHQANDSHTRSYLARLSTLSLSDLTSTEPSSLAQLAQSHLRNLYALSKRSHKAVLASSSHLQSLAALLPDLVTQVSNLTDHVPQLEKGAADFALKYDRSAENDLLDRRKQAMLLSRNIEKVSDVLELPSLLSSTVTVAQAGHPTSNSSAAALYESALDLHGHTKRLRALYPHSKLAADISEQAEVEIQNLTSILITALQSPSLKLASAIRTVGWLRRVAPDLVNDSRSSGSAATKSFDISDLAISHEGALGSLLLVCRLRLLNVTLEALEPLRELADQETALRTQLANAPKSKQPTSRDASGSQSVRYLKRYIEIFREQSFSIISMYRSIFPSNLPSADATPNDSRSRKDDHALLPLPSPLSSFTPHLVSMLSSTLQQYMSNVIDQPARESLLTQVLYCAGSLGRLGADFGMVVALLGEEALVGHESDATEDASVNDDDEPEWMQITKKHRTQAGRLEVLARGVGGTTKRSGGTETLSPPAMPAD